MLVSVQHKGLKEEKNIKKGVGGNLFYEYLNNSNLNLNIAI